MPYEFTAQAAGQMTGRCTLHERLLDPKGGAESVFGTWRCSTGDDGPEIRALREQASKLGPGPEVLWVAWPEADRDEWLRLAKEMNYARKRCRNSWVFQVPGAVFRSPGEAHAS